MQVLGQKTTSVQRLHFRERERYRLRVRLYGNKYANIHEKALILLQSFPTNLLIILASILVI